MGKKGKKKNEGTFSKAGHLAYSGFTHIDELGSLKFAVGLREHADVDAVVAKLLPMSVIVPGVPKERKPRATSPPPVIDTDEDCDKAECIAVRDKIKELEHANDDLKREVADLESGLKATMNKIANGERVIKATEENNAQLTTQLEEIKGRTATLEMDASEVERVRELLKDKIAALESRIGDLKEQIASKTNERDDLEAALSFEVTFGDPFRHYDGYTRDEEIRVRSLADEEIMPSPR